MAKGLASINIKFQVDLKQFSDQLQNSLREIDRFGQKATALGKSMSLYVTAPLIGAAAASVKFASDYQESMNKVDVAFGSAAGQVKNFAQTSLTSFGIAEGTALDMAATFGDMATSMGLPQDAAANMSQSLVGLAGDLASFKNIGIDQANTALSGVFTGETESLKRLGIVMTEANLQAFALTKGIKTQIKDMDQASKVNLRYAYIMEATKNAQGDFARTGGGAANQMRIFQESMKQLGQQFGTVILPIFTKAITGLNSMIAGFSKLSEGTKTTIVIFAGIAAAAGPVLIVLGQMAFALKELKIGWALLSKSLTSINLSPNPYVLLATAIAAIGIAVYAWYSNNQQMVSSQKALNDAVAKGNQEATNEVASLDRLYASATNVKLSTDERKKAVDELQSRFPAYFKNIQDEIILNGKAADVYKQVREAIFAKSRAQAIEGELQKRANDRVEEELKLRERVAQTRNDIQALRNGPEEIVIQEASAMDKTARVVQSKTELIALAYKRLAMQQKELQDFTSGAMKEDAILLDAKIENEKKSQKLTQDQTTANFNLANSINTVNAADAKKAGTIAFYEAQIKALRQQQTEVATTNSQWLLLDQSIADYQAKIDAISKKEVKLPKPTFEGDITAPELPGPQSLNSLEAEKSYYEGLRSVLSTTSAEYQRYSEAIASVQDKINEITGDNRLPAWVEDIKKSAGTVTQELVDIGTAFQDTLSTQLNSLITGFAEGIGNLLSGVTSIGDVGSFILQSIGDLIIQLGKAAVQIGVGMLAIKKAFVTPFGAIAAGVAMIAFGTLLKSSLPKFETGGIVGGSSKFGDKILARVNSGEMIANESQQQRIWNAMNSGGGAVINIGGTFRIVGTDLIYVLERANKKKDRTG